MPMVDIDWLKEHVSVPDDLTVEQLSQDLVKVGLETEDIHPSTVTGPVVVGRIVDFDREPQSNGKTVSWCHIDVGEKYNDTDENGNKVPRGIICGAPNVAKDALVVVALPGAVLPGDFEIATRKTYGHTSEGMCCSSKELGLSAEADGIIILTEEGFSKEEIKDIKPGDDALALLKLDRPILEINITPDRGYAFSYRGVAREYHHSTGRAYTDPVPALAAAAPKVDKNHIGDVAAKIEDNDPIHGVPGCDRYYLRTVTGFDPNAETPNWMRRRLVRAGVRTHSLAVDITNYVMLDLGQPLHAYDLDKVAQPIVVRRASEGEKLTTLDGVSRTLSHEDLVIADSPDGNEGSRVLGLAGDMGGAFSEVTSSTRNVLIEAAHFDQVTVARTARRHKLPTDASHRFERGVDDQMQPAAAQYAADLLTRYGQGEASDNPTDLDSTTPRKPILFKADWVKRLANLDLPIDEISDILTDIGCVVAGGGNGILSVTPPSWRPDLNIAPDLVEEVARIVGYDKIPVEIPSAPVKDTGLTLDQRRYRAVANDLAEAGLTETLSYPFVGDEDYEAFALDADAVKAQSVQITNPLAGDRPFLRTHVLYTLARIARRNIGRGLTNVQIYELGTCFRLHDDMPVIPALPGGVRPTDEQLEVLEKGLPDQPKEAAALLTGQAVNPGWYKESRAIDYSDALALVDRLGRELGIDLRFEQFDPDNPQAGINAATWHPGRTAVVRTPKGTAVGVAGELHPQVCRNLGLPDHSAALDLNLTAIFAELSTQPLQAMTISTFPPVREDLAFNVPEEVTAATLMDAIRRGGADDLESMRLFDVYRGEDLGQGRKSLAFSVVYRSPSKTLRSNDARAIRKRIVDEVKKLGGKIRQ
jgi:phenylalanyl-tRNA synthetase beta chain